MSPSLSLPVRALIGTTLVGLIVLASLLVSPAAALEVLEAVTADPVWFGVVVVGLYTVRPLFAWPTTPLAIVVGYGYGVALGVPIALVGIAGSILPVYFVSRWLVGPGTKGKPDSSIPLEHYLERSHDVICRYYETAGPFRGVIASRLAPIPSDVATCAAAVSGVRLRPFLAGTLVGELPWTIAAVVVGASVASLSADVLSPEGLGQYALPLALVCTAGAVALFVPRAYDRWRTQSETETERDRGSASNTPLE